MKKKSNIVQIMHSTTKNTLWQRISFHRITLIRLKQFLLCEIWTKKKTSSEDNFLNENGHISPSMFYEYKTVSPKFIDMRFNAQALHQYENRKRNIHHPKRAQLKWNEMKCLLILFFPNRHHSQNKSIDRALSVTQLFIAFILRIRYILFRK